MTYNSTFMVTRLTLFSQGEKTLRTMPGSEPDVEQAQ